MPDFDLDTLINLLKNAVALATAFLLYGNSEYPVSSFIKGKVEVIDRTESQKPLFFDLESNTTLNSNKLLATGKGSRVELRKNDDYWRLGSLSVCRWLKPDSFWLHSGSALFCTKEEREIHIGSRETKATFKGKGTIIVEATSNGGLKVIPLEVAGTLSTEKGGIKDLIGGRLLIVLGNPTEFGDAYDIDILLMLKTSRLINAFPTPLPTFQKIGLSVYVQDLKLKGKYDALIGDATTNENLQLWKFGKNTGVESSATKSPESKKGFFKSFFGKE